MINLQSARSVSRPYRTTQERDCNTQNQDQTCMTGTATGQNNKQRQLLLVSWIQGEHTSATCNVRKNGHQEAATKINTIGGVQWGKECRGGAANDIDDKLDHFALSLDCTPTTTNAPTDDTAILDSGCTSNFLSAAAPCSDKQAAHVPLNVNMPNGTTIQ
jgi:hypothetical protein